jgi:hypothetical protein
MRGLAAETLFPIIDKWAWQMADKIILSIGLQDRRGIWGNSRRGLWQWGSRWSSLRGATKWRDND